VAYYVEAKYKITSQFFAALRWNQELFDEVRNGVGAGTPWDRHTWRTDVAFGYRFTRHFQTKVQYSYNHQNGTLQQGEQLVAGQVTLKF
jgi:predicted porin